MKFKSMLVATLVASFGLGSIGFSQNLPPNSSVTVKSSGKTYKAVEINSLRFNPQIGLPGPKPRNEVEHEYEPTYKAGLPNDLKAGGINSNKRADFSTSVFFPGTTATGWEPPDPDIAVGPNHIVEVVNSDIAFYTKAGVKTLQQNFGKFFSAVSPMSFIFDPKAFYDADSGRYFVVALSEDDAAQKSEFLIAVSAGSDPNGTWKLFKIDNTATVNGNKAWLDYPGWGFSKTGVVATGNMFPFASGSVVSQVFGFQKSELLGSSVTPAQLIVNDLFTIQTAKGDTVQQGCYAVSNSSRSSADILQSIVGGTPGSTTLTVNRASVAVPTWDGYSGSVVGPNGVSVQTNDPRQLTAMVRTLTTGEVRLVSSHSVGASASDTRCSARWYEFDVTGMNGVKKPTLRQSGTIVAPATHVSSFPAIGINSKGDIGLTFSKIGTTTVGNVMVCGRKAKDALGTVSAPVVLETSVGTRYNGFSSRWGDYFDIEVDPKDNRTFWAVGMGAASNGQWMTFMKSFAISLADADLVGFGATSAGIFTSAGVAQGKLVTGNLASLTEADGNIYMISSVGIKGLGQVAGITATFKPNFSGVKPSDVRIVYKLSAPVGTTGIFFLKNRSTGNFDTYLSTALTPTSTGATTLTLSAADLAKYVSSTGDLDIVIRANQPLRNGNMPPLFNFSVDQLKVLALPPDN